MENSKTVVLTFDDAVSNHATLVGPLLRQYGFGGTFYVCEFPPDFAANKQQYMTWEQIQELDAAGFEIGNHTGTHANVAELSDAALTAELEFIEGRCASYGITPPITFAYPACRYNENAFPVLLHKGYRLARVGGARPFVLGRDNTLLVPSFPVHGADKKIFYNAIAQAAPGIIPILMFHGIPEYAHPWVDTQPDLFREYVRYLSDNGFRVAAMRDLLPWIPC